LTAVITGGALWALKVSEQYQVSPGTALIPPLNVSCRLLQLDLATVCACGAGLTRVTLRPRLTWFPLLPLLSLRSGLTRIAFGSSVPGLALLAR